MKYFKYLKYIFNFACTKLYQQHVALISTSEPRVKVDIYVKFRKVFSFELTFVYLIATRMLKVLEKYFAIWREGHNGWKNMAQWKIMSPITASVSLSLAQLAIILSTLKISPTTSIPSLSRTFLPSLSLSPLLQLFLPSADRYETPRTKRVLLNRAFLISLHPLAFSIHLQIPSPLPPHRLAA